MKKKGVEVFTVTLEAQRDRFEPAIEETQGIQVLQSVEFGGRKSSLSRNAT